MKPGLTGFLDLDQGTQFVEGALQVLGIDGASAVEDSGRLSEVGDAVDLVLAREAWNNASAAGLEPTYPV